MLIMSTIFSVILPTIDIGSDIYLSHQTLNFIGGKQVLQQCRACFHKDKKDMLENYENGCATCFRFLPNYAGNNDDSFIPFENFTYSNDNEIMYLISLYNCDGKENISLMVP